VAESMAIPLTVIELGTVCADNEIEKHNAMRVRKSFFM